MKGELIAAGRIRQYPGGILELCSLGIHAEFRGQGIGKAITRRLIEKHFDAMVWVVTEIPEFFFKSGFFIQIDFPKDLNDKLFRCRSQYACKEPLTMSYSVKV